MVSAISERRLPGSEACAMINSLPKFKRRRVSAVRDFPPGCGPNAPQINCVTNEVPVHGDNIETNRVPAVCEFVSVEPNAPQIKGVISDLPVHDINTETDGVSAVESASSRGPNASQINRVVNEMPYHGDKVDTNGASAGCEFRSNAPETDRIVHELPVHGDDTETNGVFAVHVPPSPGTNAPQIDRVANEMPVHGDNIDTGGTSVGREFQSNAPEINRAASDLSIHGDSVKTNGVAAVREFPPGCGPNAPQTDRVTNEMPVHGDNIETNGLVGIISSKVEADKSLKSLAEPETHELPACSSVVEKVAIASVKAENDGAMNAYHVDQQLRKKSDKLESNKAVLEIPKPSDRLQITQIDAASEELARTMCGISSDSGEVKVEGTSKDVDGLGSREGSGVIVEAKEVTGDKVVGSNMLPHHPVPSTSVRKEKNYPPRRRISAVRDFPPGCGPSAQLASKKPENSRAVASHEDGLVRQDKENSSSLGNMVQTSVKVIDQQVQDVRTEMKVAVAGNTVHEAEAQSKSSDEVKSCELHASTPGLIGYKRKAKENTRDAKNAVKGDVVVYVKKKIQKVTFASDAHGKSPSQRETIANGDDPLQKEVVLGLMADPHSELIKVKKNAQSSPSTPSAMQSKRKKRVSSKQDMAKSEDFKMKDTVEILEMKSVENMSPSTEINDHPNPRQLVSWKNDSPANDEPHDDFQLVASSRNVDVNLLPFGASSLTDKGARTKVRETLRLFQAIVRKLMQEEETKPKGKGNPTKRVDLLASSILKEKGKYLNNDKKILGPVPGVETGDEFHYRVELMMIGLHRQSQGGIDFVKQGGKVLATSIVASGGYDNVVDNSNILIYTGQGGNATGGDKQPEDQKLERGNLSLVNSMHEKNFVRVTRGFKEANGKGKLVSTYTYDGLYTVEDYWPESGPHGKTVYKFKLRRCPGQRELVWKELKKSTKSKVREGCCVDDISGGKERIPICAVNTVDDEKPPLFTYILSMMYPDWCSPIPPKGCGCVGGCADSEKCACAVKNGGEIPFNHDGAIVEAKPLVYECGPLCKCPSTCYNRVSQHGIQFKLEIFKTESRGWGVRSLSSIPSGSFICEYVGELLDDKEAEERTGNDEYLFDIGQNYNDHALWGELSTLMPDLPSSSSELVENVGFTIDALQYGNVGRFINHSCSPNLYAQNVLYDHEDRRIPHIMFFAAENIPPLQELTYHYNYEIDQVYDADGNIKKKSCYCGSSECTGRMY